MQGSNRTYFYIALYFFRARCNLFYDRTGIGLPFERPPNKGFFSSGPQASLDTLASFCCFSCDEKNEKSDLGLNIGTSLGLLTSIAIATSSSASLLSFIAALTALGAQALSPFYQTSTIFAGQRQLRLPVL